MYCAGCVALPTPGRIERESGGPNVDVRSLTKSTKADRLLQPGTDRKTIHAKLGEPSQTFQDGSVERTTYRSYNWWVFCIIPLGHFWGDMSPTERVYILNLRYDAQNRLESFFLESRKD